MDDSACRRLFLEPGQSTHHRSEARRAILVEGLPLDQVADRFGSRPAALRSLVSRFRSGCRAGSPQNSSPREPTPFRGGYLTRPSSGPGPIHGLHLMS
jgi:hypothetical protein